VKIFEFDLGMKLLAEHLDRFRSQIGARQMDSGHNEPSRNYHGQ